MEMEGTLREGLLETPGGGVNGITPGPEGLTLMSTPTTDEGGYG